MPVPPSWSRSARRNAWCAAALAVAAPLGSQQPVTPLVSAAWSDGPALVAGLDDFVRGLDLPIRARFGLGLARAALVGATGGLDLDDLAAALSPGAGDFGVVEIDGEPLAYLRLCTPTADLARDALLGRWDAGVVTRRDGAWLTLAADRRALAIAAALPNPPADLPKATIRARGDLDRLRRLAGAPDLGRGMDPFGRWIAGAWLAVLERAGEIRAELVVEADRLRLAVEVDATAAQDPRALPTLPEADAVAPLPPAPEGAFATLRMARSLRRFLVDRETVLSPGDAAQLGGGLAIADALCGGSFVDDVLGALREPLTLFAVARPPRGDDEVAAPPLDLPSFVLVAPLRDPATAADVERRFARTLGLFLSAASVERARNREHPFRIRALVRGGVRYHVLEPDDYFGPLPPPVDVTFSPTLAVAAGHVVLATTRDGAERAVAGLAAGRPRAVSGDRLAVAGAGVAQLIARNRELLVLDEILKNGKTPRDARRGIDDLRDIVAAFDRLEAAVVAEIGNRTRVTLDLVARPSGEPR